jgi:hypothetical protein
LRYTPTHAVQQEPMKSAREGKCFRLVSDGFVHRSRTNTRTICAGKCARMRRGILAVSAKLIKGGSDESRPIHESYIDGDSLLPVVSLFRQSPTERSRPSGGTRDRRQPISSGESCGSKSRLLPPLLRPSHNRGQECSCGHCGSRGREHLLGCPSRQLVQLKGRGCATDSSRQIGPRPGYFGAEQSSAVRLASRHLPADRRGIVTAAVEFPSDCLPDVPQQLFYSVTVAGECPRSVRVFEARQHAN